MSLLQRLRERWLPVVTVNIPVVSVDTHNYMLSQIIENESNPHLELFKILARPDDDNLRVFKVVDKPYLAPTQFSYSAPEVLAIFNQAWTSGRTSGMYLDSFIKGASSASLLLSEENQVEVTHLLHPVLEGIEEYNRYPAIEENMAECAATVASEVYSNGERVNREQLLAYNQGVWWLLGHMYNLENAYVEGFGYVIDWVFEVLRYRAERAVLED